jgi:hypothetical protein
MPDYRSLNTLSDNELQWIKGRTKAVVQKKASKSRRSVGLEGLGAESTTPIIFAEGDSWFDYPPGVDIIDHLVHHHDLVIRRFSKHGDTLDNMVFGTKSGTPQIEPLLREVAAAQPDIMLFSGGGNDVAGDELAAYLNHAGTGLPGVRPAIALYMIHTAFRNAITTFIDRVLAASPRTQFILHGYGRPFPTGNRTKCLGLPVAGPWIRPALEAKKLGTGPEAAALVHSLLDAFNEMLEGIASDTKYAAIVHYLDLRPLIQENDWRDELHLKSDVYAEVADQFAHEIRRIREGAPLHESLAVDESTSEDSEGAAPHESYWQRARRMAKTSRAKTPARAARSKRAATDTKASRVVEVKSSRKTKKARKTAARK